MKCEHFHAAKWRKRNSIYSLNIVHKETIAMFSFFGTQKAYIKYRDYYLLFLNRIAKNEQQINQKEDR